MRRQDIQLRAAARDGDRNARLQLAQRYLRGDSGFAKNVRVGLDYLDGLDASALDDAARAVAQSLALQEILEHGKLEMLERAALTCSQAQLNLAAWRLACGEDACALALLRTAQAQGVQGVRRVLETYADTAQPGRLAATLACLADMVQGLDVPGIAMAAARHAIEQGDLLKFGLAADALLAHDSKPDDELCELVSAAVDIAEKQGQALPGPDVGHIQACLEHQCLRGDSRSWFVLGRALSGISCGDLVPSRLVRGANLRKGTALLVRAADAGQSDAWLHLYRLNSDYRSSVANPQMARFYLEKAAHGGQVEAQRRLGALMLRESSSLRESEQAISWLHKAAQRQDVHAKVLLATLVFPVRGRHDDAQQAIGEMHKADPWLAMRLQLSRDFGLTKLEALTVDPAEGKRPWGLVVGRNPFISQVRLAAPRAIPAVTQTSLGNLYQAAAFFSSQHRDGASIEGDLRRRSATQRRLFERLHLDEDMFFVSANSALRDSIRVGPRWAHHSKEQLQMALA